MSGRDFDLSGRIGRATALPSWDMSPTAFAPLTYHEHPDFPGITQFRCDRLHADLSVSSCASNFRKGNIGPLACRGCATGTMHVSEGFGVDPQVNPSDDAFRLKQVALEASRGLACVRCERTTATAKRFLGHMRLVRGHSLCISCVNREYEFVKQENSKRGRPRIILYGAVITIKRGGKRKTVEIGLRSSRAEVERYVARIYPDAKLLEVEMDGELVVAPSMTVEVPAVIEPRVKPPRKSAARKPLPVSTDEEAFGNEDEPLTPSATVIDADASSEKHEPAVAVPKQPEVSQRPRVIPGSHARNLQSIPHAPGDRFGSLVAIEPGQSTYWRYRCDCGAETVKPIGRVKRGVITKCGYHCAAGKLIEDFSIETLIAFMCDRLGVPSAAIIEERVAALVPKPVTLPSVTRVRLFSRELSRIGFKPKTFYGGGKPGAGTLVPLAPDVGGKALFGCTCGHTFIEHHKRVLRGMVCPGCHSICKPEPTFAQYLTDLHEIRGRIGRAVVGTTAENAIAVGVRAYHRSLTRKPQ